MPLLPPVIRAVLFASLMLTPLTCPSDPARPEHCDSHAEAPSARSLAFYASDGARARTDACSHIEPGTRATRSTIALLTAQSAHGVYAGFPAALSVNLLRRVS